MELMTKEIEARAQAQYPLGSSFDQMVVAKFFDPTGSYAWYLMNQDPADPDYLWGIGDRYAVECGSFSLAKLRTYRGPLGIGIERDKLFKPEPARVIWERLLARMGATA